MRATPLIFKHIFIEQTQTKTKTQTQTQTQIQTQTQTQTQLICQPTIRPNKENAFNVYFRHKTKNKQALQTSSKNKLSLIQQNLPAIIFLFTDKYQIDLFFLMQILCQTFYCELS